MHDDLRLTIRGLRRSPGFTAAALLALALGIGANTAIFSVIDAVLLRPLPFRDAAQLVSLWKTRRGDTAGRGAFTAAGLDAVRDTGAALESVAGYEMVSLQYLRHGEPVSTMGARVTPNLIATLGVTPVLGRSLAPGGEAEAMVSFDLWHRRFGGDRAIIGQTVAVDVAGMYGSTQAGPAAFTIVGVLPPDLRLPPLEQAGLWIATGRDPGPAARQPETLLGIARLRRGQQAQAVQTLLNSRLDSLGWSVALMPLRETIVGNLRPLLLLLLGATGLVLLIACANLANLQLVRWSRRGREMAIRAALGAGSLRLARLLLLEALVLAAAGGACGLLGGYWCVRLLGLAAALPHSGELRLDPAALTYTAAISLLTGVLFGLAPALTGCNPHLQHALQERGRGGRLATRGWLVIAEVAVAFVLSVGAGLLLRSFARLAAVDPGFRAENVITARVSLPPSRYRQPPQRAAFYKQVLEKLRGMPGVSVAAAVNFLPMSGVNGGVAFSVEGRPPASPREIPTASFRAVSPDYFGAMGIRILEGRGFTEADLEHMRLVVNQSFARRWWPNQSPLGQRIHIGPPDAPGPFLPVVGMVADVKHFGLDAADGPTIYLPYLGPPVMTLVARGLADAGILAAAVAAVDKNQPIEDARTMRQVLYNTSAQPRLRTRLLTIFAALALVLAGLGIFGVTAYSVAQRRREIGIRMALGAAPAAVKGMILRQAIRQGLAGITLGGVAALALRGLVAHWLFGVTGADPVTFAAAACVSAGATAAAVYWPARRAAAVDPVAALREE